MGKPVPWPVTRGRGGVGGGGWLGVVRGGGSYLAILIPCCLPDSVCRCLEGVWMGGSSIVADFLWCVPGGGGEGGGGGGGGAGGRWEGGGGGCGAGWWV